MTRPPNDPFERARRKFEEAVAHAAVNPLAILAPSLCKAKNLRGLKGKLAPTDGVVRIAFVSMPAFPYKIVPFKGKCPTGVEKDDVLRTLAARADSVSEEMLNAFEEALKVALETMNANVVCVSELGFPNRKMQPMAKARQIAHKMSEKHDALIIAGTTHDSRTCYNTGFVFHPGGPDAGWPFHKANSAITMEERIAAPSTRHIPVMKTFELKIATMICLDVADFASLASVVRAGEEVSVVLVPCYTKNFEKMRDVALMASAALPGVVALVNAMVPYVLPLYVAAFGELLMLSEKVTTSVGAEVVVHRIKIDEHERKRAGGNRSAEYLLADWMFGKEVRRH